MTLPRSLQLPRSPRSRAPSSLPKVVVLPTPCRTLEPVLPVPASLLTASNAVLALFHAVLAAVTFSLGKLTLYARVYRSVNDVLDHGGGEWEVVPRLVVARPAVPLTLFTGLFFAITALFHLLNATLLRRFYLSELSRCRTPLRWVEYSLTAPLMMVNIAYVMGVRDRSLFLCLGVLVATTMPFGYWLETASRPASATTWCLPLSRRLLPWWVGHLPQTAAWLVVLLQFYDGIADSDRVPDFVPLILFSQLALFYSFGLASLASQCMPPCRFYVGELGFQALSLVSKGVLGGLLLANVIMFSSFEEIY